MDQSKWLLATPKKIIKNKIRFSARRGERDTDM